MNKKVLYIIIPCYNEEEVLAETAKRLLEKLEDVDYETHILLVDDGSKDKTWEIITDLNRKNPTTEGQKTTIEGLKLSRNKGHQNALLAGLMTAKDVCDVCISMDADLQDDIGAIDRMLAKYEEGCKVVYGVRSKREKDSFFKKMSAEGFYKIMKMMGVELVFNHADYRLMSSEALTALAEFGEVNLFLRGIVPLIGYKSDIVYYERAERFAGESKYPLSKMLAFAFQGITSFSIKPIRMITNLGIIIIILSILAIVYAFTFGYDKGWSSIILSVWILGGLQLFAIGIIGEYIGKIYLETKHRPKYIVEKWLK
ncbi:MAG: glycosyltransferase family 2 protein [Ruminococcus sp.]|jgi:glycosyltransferase involved in cell wall biosynthesis|nr:glycosyltransferase family 2 protein [Ruminococcus sp.]